MGCGAKKVGYRKFGGRRRHSLSYCSGLARSRLDRRPCRRRSVVVAVVVVVSRIAASSASISQSSVTGDNCRPCRRCRA